MHCRRSSLAAVGRNRQRGAALVLALLVFAVSTALVVGMKSDFTRLYERAAYLFFADQANAYLRGAEGLASLALQADFDQDAGSERPPRDDLTEIWAQQAAPYALDDGGWLVGSLEDLQGRFNLNHLAQAPPTGEEQPRFTPAQAQFIRLLQALGEPQVGLQQAIEITAAIGDWLDADLTSRAFGAEDDYYFGLQPGYRAANRPMASSSELLAVAGVSPELFAALAPLVTVWPETPGTLNIHTAAAPLLRSIAPDIELDPLSEIDGQGLVEYRDENGFLDLDDFLAQPSFSGREAEMTGMRTLLGEESSWFLLRAEVEVADRKMRLYSVLERRARQITPVLRAAGSL